MSKATKTKATKEKKGADEGSPLANRPQPGRVASEPALQAKTPSTFYQRVIKIIKRVPKGKVVTYGQVARMAGSPRGARQVSWTLHVAGEREKLPWQRVINREGKISIPKGDGYELQKALLEGEGVKFDRRDTVDLEKYGWGG